MRGVWFWIIGSILVICVISIFRQTHIEGFSLYGSYNNNRNGYIQHSKQKYNSLSETTDVTGKGFPDTNDQAIIDQMNKTISTAFQTSDLTHSGTANTLLGISPTLSKATIHSKNSELHKEAEKCEAILTRDSCAILDDPQYSKCGICIKGGSPITFDNSGKHIGGLLLLPDDKKNAENAVAGTYSTPMYTPTVGECPSGYFFATRAECEKQVNRLDCSEVGLTGGFDNGKTIEGKKIANLKCAQVANSNNLFVYEPKTRSFDVNLRVLTPFGTGICQVTVYDSMKKQVGRGQSNTPGVEFVITILNVKEGDTLIVVVSLEAPYRYGAKRELYQVQSDNKSLSANDAASVCKRYGSSQATMSDLQNAFSQYSTNGSEVCSPGWTADGGLAWISQGSMSFCGEKNVNQSQETKGNAWCMGLRPPPSDDPTVTIANWNRKQASAFGTTNPTPYKRAILMQWEMTSGFSSRMVGFESTILAVDGIGPTKSTTGSNTFTNLRTYGTFATSPVIQVPSYNSKFLTNGERVWFWTNKPNSHQAIFRTSVPGIFLDSYYPEDVELSAYGPLVGQSSTLSILQSSPCKQANQKPGAYSLSCLQSAFVTAGGDINKGELVLKNGGLSQLNSRGSIEAISVYLDNLVSIATTGIDLNGNFVGKTSEDANNLVNAASLQMFGFPIITPCENITQDIAGNTVIVTKTDTSIDSWCLDYLWNNTGSELENGYGDSDLKIKHTYTNISDRFSGLRSNEGTIQKRKTSPFMLCQNSGSASPIQPNGKPNMDNVNYAHSLGDIAKIQKYYDSIYNAANNRNSGKKQSKAVEQCYGLKRIPPPPPPQPRFDRLIGPGYGFYEGWGNPVMLNGGAGFRSILKTGDKIVLKITFLPNSITSFPIKNNNPTYTPPQDNVYYLKYDPETNQGTFANINDYDATYIHTIVFPEETERFLTFANGNNTGLMASRNMFALMNSNGNYLTVQNDATTYRSGMWPSNQPGELQIFNWNDFSGFSNLRYPFGPYCPGANTVIIRGNNENGYIIRGGNFGTTQLMEFMTVQ